jgi:hypothetical protein
LAIAFGCELIFRNLLGLLIHSSFTAQGLGALN